jgi:RNA polymerase sigma-70 factor, ECF subfamily
VNPPDGTERPDPPTESDVGRFVPLVYDELKRIARRLLRGGARRPGVLEPTALVHEALVRLIDRPGKEWNGRTHFLAAGATTMRRLLVDEARTASRRKHGGEWHRVSFGHVDKALFREPLGAEELLALDQALDRLAALDERQAKVVELRFLLRFFAGLDVSEVAEVLGVSRRTVELAWTHAKAWLRRELAGVTSPAPARQG